MKRILPILFLLLTPTLFAADTAEPPLEGDVIFCIGMPDAINP